MKTRILIGIGAGLLGAGIGAGLGWMAQKDGEPFPVYIVVAVAVIFAACGALAKEKWRQAVEDFFWHVLP